MSEEDSGTSDQGAQAQFFHGPESGTRREIFPGVEIRAICGDELMFSVVNLEPNSVVPMHDHPHEQMGILISGRLEFTIGGQTRILKPGEIWRIPGGVPHRVVAMEEGAVALDVFHPIREDYR